jgi:hypothetical protein
VTGTFDTDLSTLRTMGLVEYPEKGAVAAARLLWPN